jgi:probable rRNA maturation factor
VRPIYRRPWRIDPTIRAGVQSPLSLASLVRSMAATLDAAGAPSPASIGLVLSNDAELAALNREHLGVDGPTDVLSFPLLPPEAFPKHEGGVRRRRDVPPTAFVLPAGLRRHLGDVVISVERAEAQAAAGRGGQTGDVRWSTADELRLLALHGTLHICGWDHADPTEKQAMRALERRLLGATH